jgi:hypothetical protein
MEQSGCQRETDCTWIAGWMDGYVDSALGGGSQYCFRPDSVIAQQASALW